MSLELLLRWLQRQASLVLTLGLAACLVQLVSVEWSSPYCMNPTDGPGYAFFGAPLPYLRWGGFSSFEFVFMPHGYILNLLILVAIAVRPMRWLMHRALDRRPRYLALVGPVGLFLLTAAVGHVVFLVGAGVYDPVVSVGSELEPYGDLRPVGVSPNDGHYACSPSAFWGEWGGR